MKKIYCWQKIRLLLTLSALIIVFGAANSQQSDEQPAPCGPAGDLSAEVGRNVAANSRCFELRMYTVEAIESESSGNRIDTLHERFRAIEVEIFERNGAAVIGTWQSLDNPRTFVWMLAYRNRSHRDEVWAAVAEDPQFEELISEQYAAPLEGSSVFMMSASDYSPLK